MDVQQDQQDESSRALFAMPIGEFFEPQRIRSKGFPVVQTQRLYKMLQERSREPRYFPLFGVNQLETVHDLCRLTPKILRSMPGISARLERLLSRLLAAEGASLGCAIKKLPC
jgi:hypothetical protein